MDLTKKDKEHNINYFNHCQNHSYMNRCYHFWQGTCTEFNRELKRAGEAVSSVTMHQYSYHRTAVSASGFRIQLHTTHLNTLLFSNICKYHNSKSTQQNERYTLHNTSTNKKPTPPSTNAIQQKCANLIKNKNCIKKHEIKVQH